jgi:hypothetical protein
MQKLIKQVFHDVRTWEEVAHNMWGEATDPRAALEIAIGFTSDHKLYGSYMKRVCENWTVSCENALTDPHLNQKAWLGHAAVALAHNIPEDITRKAWSYLSDEQKHLANKEAERNIALWKERYIKSKGLREKMGGTLLF